jgi:hypothetical protein
MMRKEGLTKLRRVDDDMVESFQLSNNERRLGNHIYRRTFLQRTDRSRLTNPQFPAPNSARHGIRRSQPSNRIDSRLRLAAQAHPHARPAAHRSRCLVCLADMRQVSRMSGHPGSHRFSIAPMMAGRTLWKSEVSSALSDSQMHRAVPNAVLTRFLRRTQANDIAIWCAIWSLASTAAYYASLRYPAF